MHNLGTMTPDLESRPSGRRNTDRATSRTPPHLNRRRPR
ncbi:hypothetical protein SCATT_00060 [Streptantibioticus cattleyicolor NRRL 8057 = DSM 46488]|uniref:Uncharacterized protein n=1 Tax=Streptantibioticus cattleyicolor (strain ATCC 35852 / DSM 46488 / JCM 4925 / NBRC 14057 / NRRL 8057) TaxID=1003195 RepID=G8WVT2_STREN|nr:hypothetical protein SCATT_00060 [Streptantibioticus cattleyicolor NRRL 8057 = DSM 46488]